MKPLNAESLAKVDPRLGGTKDGFIDKTALSFTKQQF